MKFTYDSINLNPEIEARRIEDFIRETIHGTFKKKGAVIGLSGGIDSSVVAALCSRALGSNKVKAVLLPEKDSSPESKQLAMEIIKKYDISYSIEDISEGVTGLGCYRRRDEAVKRVFPEYSSDYKMKIFLPRESGGNKMLNVFYISITSPEGQEKTARLPINEYLQIMAASNFKQRTRMSMLYYYAEANNYAVVGTGNKDEHGQGFFVKHGDGAADLMPIIHLFKTQIYQIAEYLDIPAEIIKRTPTSDTYSAEQTQEEFFFKVPFEVLDRIWFGLENNISPEKIAEALSMDPKYVGNVIQDISNKIRTTEYLRKEPLALE